ncbi:BTB/POZ protein [Ilyonectria robusta]|uniref:BTB/POZ protein n=1 Tax=Ilyonectria robusta TaxID=1079257 RepID=UPI001E8D9A90|nr:BTB/POZ protein [Ilyonectria robusta]KAH8688392.1 BTB/POZ protein [Ilyonectria robusta]
MGTHREPSVSSTGSEHRDSEYNFIHDASVISVHASLSTLLFSEKFSDMTIRCGGREFKAHRAIICTQSSFFDRAFSSDFREATSQTIDLPEDDPAVLERILEFLYKGNYTDGTGNTWEKPSTAAMMSPEEVQENLNNPAGFLSNGKNLASNEEEYDDLNDPTYAPGEIPEPEVEEEYEEFDEESIDESEDEGEEKGEGQNDTVPPDDLVSKLSNLEPKEALQALAKERDDLFLPLRLYVMADKYDVPALRLLARDRFYRAAELVWEEAECFPEVVDELYRCTPETDTAMRDIVCRLVGSRIKNDEIRTKMRPVMAEHGDFAVGVLEYMMYLSKEMW